jgi:hypothetical protein
LHKDDIVALDRAPFADVPCFLPVVPKTTSCKPKAFQQIEYPHVKHDKSSGDCWNSTGGIGALQKIGLFTLNGSGNMSDNGITRLYNALFTGSSKDICPILEGTIAKLSLDKQATVIEDK